MLFIYTVHNFTYEIKVINKIYKMPLDSIHRAATADLCLIVPKGLKNFPDASDRLTGYIDVWWIMHDGGLLIILPFLLKQHKVWSQCKLRIFAVAQIDDNSVKMKQDLEKWVYQLRIDAVVDVVEFENKAISAYTYERTLLMEERTKLAHELHLSKQDIEHEVLIQLLNSFMYTVGNNRVFVCSLNFWLIVIVAAQICRRW